MRLEFKYCTDYDQKELIDVLKLSVFNSNEAIAIEKLNTYKEIKNRHMYTLIVNSELIGCVGVEVGKTINIQNIAVVNAFQKRGYGKILVNFVKKKYIHKDIELETDFDAVEFYKKIGFVCSASEKENRFECKYVKSDHSIDKYLDYHGLVEIYPTDWDSKQIVLKYIADSFEKDIQYSEKEVNDIIKKTITFSDYAIIRRDLFDSQLIDRTPNGQFYWLR
jgi:predicted GNAT family N-acyltransferase